MNNMRAIVSAIASGRVSLLRAVGKSGEQVNRASFLAVLLDCGLLQELAKRPMSFEDIAEILGCLPEMEDALRAWLRLGATLNVLGLTSGLYTLRSRQARRLTDPRNDAMAAMAQAIPIEQRLVLETPHRVASGARVGHDEPYSHLIARESRQLEPFLLPTLDSLVPRTGAFHVLDVGCGSGGYLRHLAERNPGLTAIGIDQAPAVVEQARLNIEHWNLRERVAIEAATLTSLIGKDPFDLAMLNLVVHYTPVPKRTALLTQVKELLKPQGHVLVTNPTTHRGSRFEWLNLWGLMTEGCGPIPEEQDLAGHLTEAGFAITERSELIPGTGFICFTGTSQTRS